MIDLARGSRGTVTIEFAIIAPVLLLLVLGTFQFGLVISNYVQLTNAVGAGTRQLSLSRGDSSPYTDTVGVITGSSPSLSTSSLTITLSVNGTNCTNDSTCSTALSNAAGQSATVTATYPCSLAVYGYNFAPSCTLSSQMTGLVN
ncbi:MAG TPA: TadE family protein [Stellaceae bacterium]|nr:TadE family protein [Stellaceae bacterium]